MKTLLVFAVISMSTLAGCSATPERMVALEMGMSRAQVIKVMGAPISVSSIDDRDYLNYNLCVSGCTATPLLKRLRPFYVRLVNGKVDSFGEKGDFDSTKTPTTRVEIDKTIRGTIDSSSKQEQDMFSELRKLKELVDAGIITPAEFEARKKIILSR